MGCYTLWITQPGPDQLRGRSSYNPIFTDGLAYPFSYLLNISPGDPFIILTYY